MRKYLHGRWHFEGTKFQVSGKHVYSPRAAVSGFCQEAHYVRIVPAPGITEHAHFRSQNGFQYGLAGTNFPS